MDELQAKIAKLELEGLDLDELDLQGIEQATDEPGLESLTTGHAMVEIGASLGGAACCSCCLVCCCCPCMG